MTINPQLRADAVGSSQRCLMRYEIWSGKGIAALSRAMRRDREREKNRCLEAALCLAARFFGFFPGF
jgi:hypothetical protein